MIAPASWALLRNSALFIHLWQSTLFLGAIWLLSLALRHNAARTRYRLWMIASAKFLIPFSLLIDAGEWVRTLLAAPPVGPPGMAAVMGLIAQPFPQSQFFDVTEPSVSPHRAEWLPTVLLAIWACGMLIVLFRWVRGWLQIHAAVRAASPLELMADVPALSIPALLEPGIFGIFRPVLLLPAGILNCLTPTQLKAIVAHEMCHVRRRDNLTFALHMIVEALFWFYPAVWWIGTHLIEERECACDEAVVQLDGEAEIYAEGILNVCKLYVESPLACAPGVSGSNLKKRILRIMAKHVSRKLDLRRKLLLGAFGLLAVAIPLMFGLTHAAQAPSPPAMSAWEKAAGGKMSFEVAAIHLAKPGTFRPPNIALNIDDTSIPPGGRFFADFPLEVYIEFAFKIMPTPEQKEAMIAGLPKWVRTDHFVIQAEAPGNPTKDQMRLMMQSLLTSRFKLKVHFETRTEPVLALVLAKPGKLGARIRPHSQGLPCNAKWTMPPDLTSPSVPPGGFIPVCGSVAAIRGPNHTVLLGARNTTLEQIADYLSSVRDFGRRVVNGTGLSGRFDYSLQWTRERNRPSASGSAAQFDLTGPTLLEALRDQFGMKLKSSKAPVSMLVIDHVEPPPPN